MTTIEIPNRIHQAPVEAPIGARVDYVPDGAESRTVDGIVYFVFNDTYYRPFYSGSDVVYMVVENPESAA